MAISILLITGLTFGSLLVWIDIARRLQRGQPVINWNPEPRARWRSAAELVAVFLALASVVLQLLPQLIGPSPERPPVDVNQVIVTLAVFLTISLFLLLLLAFERRSLTEFGITMADWKRQFRLGGLGFLAAVIPMAISMFLTLPFRSPDQQHSLLKLLSASPDFLTVAAVAAMAVVGAPLLEELIYRVILQGWLSTLLPPAIAVGLAALAFSLVHGWRDGLALVPLAIVLGIVFHRRHSYLAVVMIHALFNATMLTVQLLDRH